jgi:hypothetical protein
MDLAGILVKIFALSVQADVLGPIPGGLLTSSVFERVLLDACSVPVLSSVNDNRPLFPSL